MISYLKIGLYILFMLIYYNSSEQTNADFLNWQQNLKTAKPFFTDYKTFFEIKVKEVSDTTKPFSFDSGPVFGYCGDIVGGIKNLLQTNISSTPHVFFENKPLQNHYVLFYGFGSNMDGSKISDTSKCYSNVNSFNGREIALKILEQQFNFEVKESKDSLEYIELKISDYSKLLLHKTPIEKCNQGGWAMEDTINNYYLGTCSSLVWISTRIEKKLNIYTIVR